jgi:hypothetical protein
MATEKDLEDGFKEFLSGAIDEEAKLRYRLAVTAYFKAMTQLCDLFILQKKGFAPKNHTERFRLLESNYPEIYSSMDNVFSTYQDTYSVKINKDSCLLIKNELKKIARITGFEKEFAEAVKRL